MTHAGFIYRTRKLPVELNLSTSDTPDLEDLEREFIVSEQYEQDYLKSIMTRFIGLGIRVTQNGRVIAKLSGLSQRERIFLVVAARYVGNRLQDSIPAEVSLAEVVEMAGIPRRKAATSRMSELSKEGFVESSRKGRYKASSLPMIEEFLKNIESKLSKKK